jgi:enoyl-CoA hydratase/carnithine racemase
MTDVLRLDRDGDVLTITLTRPEAGNSLNAALVSALRAAIGGVRDSDVKVVAITGSGRFFCAGADLREMDQPDPWLREVRDTFSEIAALPVPVVAAINGACAGGGMELALACDIRVAARSARLGVPEIAFGALPAAGGPARLARLIGPGAAKLLVFTGELVSAERAASIGLVDDVVDEGELDARVRELTATLTLRAGYALRTAKRAIDAGLDLPVEQALDLEYGLIDGMATPEERQAEIARVAARDPTYARIFEQGRSRKGDGDA